MRKKRNTKKQGSFVDVFRKGAFSGVTELRMPKEIRRALLANIENIREGALEIFAQEVSRVLSKVDFQRVVNDVLQNYTLNLEARITLSPKKKSKDITKATKR